MTERIMPTISSLLPWPLRGMQLAKFDFGEQVYPSSDFQQGLDLLLLSQYDLRHPMQHSYSK